jgi:hypothetical protein
MKHKGTVTPGHKEISSFCNLKVLVTLGLRVSANQKLKLPTCWLSKKSQKPSPNISGNSQNIGKNKQEIFVQKKLSNCLKPFTVKGFRQSKKPPKKFWHGGWLTGNTKRRKYESNDLKKRIQNSSCGQYRSFIGTI